MQVQLLSPCHTTGLFPGDNVIQAGLGIFRKDIRLLFKAIIFQKSWC